MLFTLRGRTAQRAIQAIGGTMPENLPPEENIVKGGPSPQKGRNERHQKLK